MSARLQPQPATATAPARPRVRTALHHLRQRRRRQEHADRPPAGGQQGRAAGPAGRRAALAAKPTWRCSPTASPPSANRASPSTWPTATSPRPAASSSSATRRATSSTRATWSRPHRAPTPPWCWSMRPSCSGRKPRSLRTAAADAPPLPAGAICCACRRSCSRSTSSTPWTIPTLAFEQHPRGARRISPPPPALPSRAIVPISALKGHNVVERQPGWCGYQGPSLLQLLEQLDVTAAETSRSLRLPGAVGREVLRPRPTPGRAAACSGAGSPRAPSSPASRSRCCPAARPRRWPRC